MSCADICEIKKELEDLRERLHQLYKFVVEKEQWDIYNKMDELNLF